MHSTWKSNLQEFLQNNNEQELNTSLRKIWIDSYPEDKKIIYRFLFDTHQFKSFLYLFLVDVESEIHDLPWLAFFELIENQRVKIPIDVQKDLNKYLLKKKELAKSAEDARQTIESLRKKIKNTFVHNITQRKQELLDSAKIAESERLFEQQLVYLEELKKISPSEFSFQSMITDQQKNKAEYILSRNKKKNLVLQTQLQNSDEEKEIISHIATQAEKYYSMGKAKACDFAYLLRTIGEQEKAVDFIYNKNESDERDWELLDYLFFGRQFLSLLDHCSQMKRKHASNPDALFSIYYVEAVAYWELGEREMAMELMTELTSMRPNFKSAMEILNQWKESFE